jgi:hypothetical protein
MSDGPTHRRISRAIAIPTAVGVHLLGHNPLLALSAGVACYLSGCGPDLDQTEAHLPPRWERFGCVTWIVGVLLLLWWLKDAPAP